MGMKMAMVRMRIETGRMERAMVRRLYAHAGACGNRYSIMQAWTSSMTGCFAMGWALCGWS
jgi:hypothetical protein